jgi:hypothetical protein
LRYLGDAKVIGSRSMQPLYCSVLGEGSRRRAVCWVSVPDLLRVINQVKIRSPVKANTVNTQDMLEGWAKV